MFASEEKETESYSMEISEEGSGTTMPETDVEETIKEKTTKEEQTEEWTTKEEWIHLNCLSMEN